MSVARMEPDARRRQTAEAARGLYATRPYDAVAAAELTVAAGVARGLIDHYLGSR